MTSTTCLDLELQETAASVLSSPWAPSCRYIPAESSSPALCTSAFSGQTLPGAFNLMITVHPGELEPGLCPQAFPQVSDLISTIRSTSFCLDPLPPDGIYLITFLSFTQFVNIYALQPPPP